MNKQLTTIYVVRHGETESNVKAIVDGHFNAPLTENGKEQAKALKEKFKAVHFDAVFSSDLVRAKGTAELLALDRQLAVNTTAMLRERYYGVYEGKPGKDYEQDNKAIFEKFHKLSEAEKRKFRIHGSIESEEEMMSRFITKLREIAVTYSGKKVLVVSHGSVMRTFIFHLGFGTREDFSGGSLLNTAYMKLESDGVDFFLKELVGHQKNNLNRYS